MSLAVVRAVSRSMQRCELTHRDRARIDTELASKQHESYIAALESLGYDVVRLPEEPDLPDSIFVEDVAVVFPEVAISTRPGAPSRRPEVESVAAALSEHRPVVRIEPPGTLDGGDVLVVGRDVYVGSSSRSNPGGAEQLRNALEPYGYAVHATPLRGCLHLKSAVTQVTPAAVLLNPDHVDGGRFRGMDILTVDPAEPDGANALMAGDGVVYPAGFPRTASRLADHGIRVVTVDVGEVRKAEGGVTCCSILID